MSRRQNQNKAKQEAAKAFEARILAARDNIMVPPEDFNSTELCSICLDELGVWNPTIAHGAVRYWTCTHWFHADCLNTWMSKCSIERYVLWKHGVEDPCKYVPSTRTCPTCRSTTDNN
jgi:hypothetical protein